MCRPPQVVWSSGARSLPWSRHWVVSMDKPWGNDPRNYLEKVTPRYVDPGARFVTNTPRAAGCAGP